MRLNDRQKAILETIESRQKVSVAVLSKQLFVSDMTIRRDLQKLEKEGLIKRYHGGALALKGYIDYPFEMRMYMNEKEKKSMASEAEQYVEDGQTVFLQSSSTCAYIVPVLKARKNITVVTNSVQIMLMLANLQIPCMLSGGEYYKEERCLVGRIAENFFREIYTDVAFFSCSGISEEGMITEIDAETAEITRIAFRNARQKILLADNSKAKKLYTHHICHIDEFDRVICF